MLFFTAQNRKQIVMIDSLEKARKRGAVLFEKLNQEFYIKILTEFCGEDFLPIFHDDIPSAILFLMTPCERLGHHRPIDELFLDFCDLEKILSAAKSWNQHGCF